MFKLFRCLVLILLVSFLGFSVSYAGTAFSAIDANSDGVAIQGYDVVAYFIDQTPKKGTSDFKTDYAGREWYFENQANLDLFVENPEQYIPQYGGHCAFATANNFLVSGDPKRWKIVDDKLYLNNNLVVHKLWKGNIPTNISSADNNWPSLYQKLESNAVDH
jgi:YHS domain-containing protein